MTNFWTYGRWAFIVLTCTLVVTLMIATADMVSALNAENQAATSVEMEGLIQRRKAALEQLALLPAVQAPIEQVSLSVAYSELNETQILVEIRDASAAAGVELISSQVATASGPPDMSEARVVIRARGAQSAILNFAEALRTGSLHFGFETFEILPSTLPDAGQTLELSGVLLRFSQDAF